jgi:hypothetical protein
LQVVKFFFPRLVDLHNYSSENNTAQKQYNWNTLNSKVFRRMGFAVSDSDVKDVVTCKRGAIEKVSRFFSLKNALVIAACRMPHSVSFCSLVSGPPRRAKTDDDVPTRGGRPQEARIGCRF